MTRSPFRDQALASAALATGDPDERARIRGAGFFPGLGSRSHYQGISRSLLDSGIADIDSIYQEAASALGMPGRPERLIPTAENLPAGKLDREGFIGAALLVHSLVLDAYLRHHIALSDRHVDFVAYTGESFGILTAAVAAGAISVGDGAKVARAFTPLMLRAAPISEPHHVIGIRALTPDALAEVLGRLGEAFEPRAVEVHKRYSATQANVYVHPDAKTAFDRLTARHPGVTAVELKDPTVFLAHSARLRPAREALDRFLDVQGIRFADPRVPVVANHAVSVLTTADGIRGAVLAMADEVMASQDTCRALDGLGVDFAVELGLGGKSVQLLRDNHVTTPTTAYTGEADTGRFLRTMAVLDDVGTRLRSPAADDAGGRLTAEDRELLRRIFGVMAEDDFGRDCLARTMSWAISAAMVGPDTGRPAPAHQRFLEVFQHSRNYRDHVDTAGGDLVLKARLAKQLTEQDPEVLGRARAHLRVLAPTGAVRTLIVDGGRPEVAVFHFDALAERPDAGLRAGIHRMLKLQPTARREYDTILDELGVPDAGLSSAGLRIVYQYLLFGVLAQHRPALLAQSDHYLRGVGPVGWLAALAVGGALSPADAVEAALAGPDDDGTARILKALRSPDLPLLAPDGVPIQSRRDLQEATAAVLRRGVPDSSDGDTGRIHLNGDCQVITLGARLSGASLDAGAHRCHVVAVGAPDEAWRRLLNPGLDAVEEACLLALTPENALVLTNARYRRVLPSTVNAYLGVDEDVVGFGKGGSESMTVFVRREGEDRIRVRKILSEALTTARWDPDAGGVMLPPFAKARKQAEFLQGLPESVRGFFPEVYSVVERELPVPPHLRGGGARPSREVVYEMSYVGGEEVSRYVERHCPPPAVVARLYEEIIRILNDRVHSVARVPAPGETLEVSYFRKIEDRLDLCRRTAPQTFHADLLDSERIVVNGVEYLNAPALLRRFRQNPEFLAVLEPAYHSLVVGDTNTENIKIGDAEPLLRAQRAIESGAGPEAVAAALAAITARSLDLRFLDPRAIGFKSDGRDTRDDAMYDNKPWHNSIGHYDEIHFEHFTLDVRVGPGRTPEVDVAFLDGNPYQRSYRVRDVSVAGGAVDAGAPRGLEDFFASVMTAALGLDDPDSPYLREDPNWLIRFVFMMGQHFTAMPPFHFQKELDGTLLDTYADQRRPVAIYCEGIKWLNWALQMLEGSRTSFLGLPVPAVMGRSAS